MASVILKITELELKYYVLDEMPPELGKTRQNSGTGF